MDSRVHFIIAVIAAFAGGEVTGMVLILALRSRIQSPGPPPGARQRDGVPGRVVPLSRDRPLTRARSPRRDAASGNR
jgi:hypothetical protein